MSNLGAPNDHIKIHNASAPLSVLPSSFSMFIFSCLHVILNENTNDNGEEECSKHVETVN